MLSTTATEPPRDAPSVKRGDTRGIIHDRPRRRVGVLERGAKSGEGDEGFVGVDWRGDKGHREVRTRREKGGRLSS